MEKDKRYMVTERETDNVELHRQFISADTCQT